MDLDNLTDSLSSSLKKAQGPQMLDLDSANRVFRTMVNEGMSQGFDVNKPFLSQIFDMMDRLQTDLLENDANANSFLSLGDLYDRMEENHINLGGRGKFPDRERFAYYLAILATEEPPFLHTIREFILMDGQLRVKTSYVGPSQRFPDIAVKAYSAAIKRTTLILNQARKSGELFIDWDQAMRTLKSGGIEGMGLRRERVDHVLRGLFLRPSKDKEFTSLAGRINGELQQWLFMPLVQQLRNESVVIVIGLDDLRASGKPELKQLGNLIYLNNPQRLSQRFLHLCQLLIDTSLNSKLDAAMLSQAEKNRDDPETFLEHAGPMAEELLSRVKSGLSLAQPFLDVAIEAGKLAEWFRLRAKQQQAETELNELQVVVQKIKKFGNFLDVRNERKLGIKDKYVRFFLEDKVPGILATTVPFMKYDPNFDPTEFESIYVIYKDRAITGNAIDNAVDVYQRAGDDYLLHVLDKLLGLDTVPDAQLKMYVPPVHLVRLRDALKRSYIKYLPFFPRIILRLLSSEPSEEQVVRAKKQLLARDVEKIQRIKERSFRSEKREADRQVKARARRSLADGAADVSPVQRAEILGKLKPFLDGLWDRGEFPTRKQIVQNGELGTPIVLENFMKVVDKGDPANEIAMIPAEGSKVYGTRAYLEKNRDAVIARCEKVIAQELEATGQAGIDETTRARANRRRRLHTAVMQHVQKLF